MSLAAARSTNYVRVFDTTLRDGEQSPGASLTSAEKLEIARQLARLGVDVIEAGFPAASPDDLEAVRTIAREVGHSTNRDARVPIILTRARQRQRHRRLLGGQMPHRASHLLATSDIHSNTSQDDARRRHGARPRWWRPRPVPRHRVSPEDAGRSTRLLRIVTRPRSRRRNDQHPRASAADPGRVRRLIMVIAATPGAEHVTWSVLPRLPAATANSLRASGQRRQVGSQSAASASAPATRRSKKW
jgi:hypothetical protein